MKTYRILCTLAVCLLHLNASAAIKSDDFNDGVIDPEFWETPSLFTETNGVWWIKDQSEITQTLCSFSDNFEITVDYDWTYYSGADEDDAARAYVILHNAESDTQVYLYLKKTPDWMSVQIHYSVGSTWYNIASTSMSLMEGKLRLRRLGNTIYGDYWTGSSWVNVGNKAFPDEFWTCGLRVSARDDSEAHWEVEFDNFWANANRVIDPHVITTGEVWGGTISPTNKLVRHMSDATFTITPDNGYEVLDVLVDGASIGATNSYTFLSVTNNHSIEAVFTSPFKARIYPAVEVAWNSVSGEVYQVQWSPTVEREEWFDLGATVTASAPETVMLDSTRDGTNKFYRIELVE